MLERKGQLRRLRGLLSRNRVVAIIGARQVGKTTLAHQLLSSRRGSVHLFDLEDPEDLRRLDEPKLALASLSGLVVIDEVQRRPDLFNILRLLVDRGSSRTRFLVLGSASPDLLRQSSESLAGRIAYHELDGFSLPEVGGGQLERLWLRGGFPRSFLARSHSTGAEWRREFIRTFLERDVPQLGIGIAATTLRRFWSMLAHYHAQVWNASEFARSFGVADTTVRRYLDLLASTFMVRILPPLHASVKKRLVKSPKVYIKDSGLLHTLLGLVDRRDVERHPKLGASWEGFALEQVVQCLGARSDECYFYATHSGAELDLVIVRGNTKIGFEFKRTDAPRTTRSMLTSMSDLGLQRLDVIHAGTKTFPLQKRVRAVAAGDILGEIKPLRG